MKVKWEIRISIYLISASVLLYLIDLFLYHDASYIMDNFLLQLAFQPIYVLLATFTLDRILARREKSQRLKKLNMVIGVFFSEVGTELLDKLVKLDGGLEKAGTSLNINNDFTPNNFKETRKYIKDYSCRTRIDRTDLIELKDFLIERKSILLRLLENPNLLEHESFTDLLWAVFHLMDELSRRKDLSNIKEVDLEHLRLDVERFYKMLILEWLCYMEHLKEDYPFLFSLAVRTNPFASNKETEVLIAK